MRSHADDERFRFELCFPQKIEERTRCRKEWIRSASSHTRDQNSLPTRTQKNFIGKLTYVVLYW